jgi:hypothetical protein
MFAALPDKALVVLLISLLYLVVIGAIIYLFFLR